MIDERYFIYMDQICSQSLKPRILSFMGAFSTSESESNTFLRPLQSIKKMSSHRSLLYQLTANQSQHMLTHDYLHDVLDELPICIAITGFEVQADTDTFFTLAVSFCNTCLMEREITSKTKE